MLDAYTKARSLIQLESRLPQNREEVKSALQGMSDNHDAALLLARIYRQDGSLDQSKQILETLLAHGSIDVSVQLELAKIHHQQNDLQSAIGLLTTVTSTRPELVENWLLLEDYLQQDDQQGAAQNARAQYEMIKAFNDNLDRAEKAFVSGEYVRSDNLCRKLLQQVPGEFRAMRLLARLAKQFRHYEISTSLLAQCVETRPMDVALGLDYAYSLLASRDFNALLQQCDRLINIEPGAIDAYIIKAEALYNLTRYREAIQIYREVAAVHEDPGLPLLYLGKALKTVGESEEAINCFHRALETDNRLGQAYWELANLKTYRFSDEQIDSMRSLLKQSGLSPINTILIRFSLGKALEDAERFEESFQHYQAANSAYAGIRPYRYSNKNAAHRLTFSQAFFSAQKDNGSGSDAPVFVVGLPRSGSTLVEQILTSHSQVDSTRELTAITSISRELNGSSLPGQGQYPDSVANLSAGQIDALAKRYLDEVQPYRQDAPFFVDKAPGNFQHIGLIKTLFPKAKIIDIRRNPMASGWSLYRHFFAESFLFSYDLKTIGKYYNDYIELMDHWHSVLPGQVLTLEYEDLVRDLPSHVEKILQYCGLPFEQACVDFHLNKRAVATPSSEQVRQPIFTDALEHWKNYEAFLTPLKQVIRA